LTRVLLGYVLWLVAIGGVRRLYWWSPLVLLMIESTCDRRMPRTGACGPATT
jgi:hypothetical protein